MAHRQRQHLFVSTSQDSPGNYMVGTEMTLSLSVSAGMLRQTRASLVTLHPTFLCTPFLRSSRALCSAHSYTTHTHGDAILMCTPATLYKSCFCAASMPVHATRAHRPCSREICAHVRHTAVLMCSYPCARVHTMLLFTPSVCALYTLG